MYMKISFRERRSSKYQNRIFVLLLLMAAVPLLIAGAISYKIYMDEVTKQTDLSMEAIETQIYKSIFPHIIINIRGPLQKLLRIEQIAVFPVGDAVRLNQPPYFI